MEGRLMTTETAQPSPRASRLVLVVGFVVYVAVQGYLLASPLWNWNLTPEVDDALTYVLKSRQMEECFTQNCPALQDLRHQLLQITSDPKAEQQRLLASAKVFPVYHLLFSVVLVGLSKLGMSLMEAYRFLWYLSPAIFGLAFAYWLSVLLGPGPAGVALILLAFKVFPDTGLHHLVPSNFTMALAVMIWARIISRQGQAPWTLFLGSLVLIGMHLIGVIYAGMAALLALAVAPPEKRKRVWVTVSAVAATITIGLLVVRFIKRPFFVFPFLIPVGDHPLRDWLVGVGRNFFQIIVENVRLEAGLWGALPLFCGALALGLGTLTPSARRPVFRMLLIYGVSLGGLLFFVSNHPADVLLRLWIPLVVLLFGLVGQAFWYVLGLSLVWWRQYRLASPGKVSLDFKHFWPVVALAVLLGYAGDMMFRGGEQVLVMSKFLRERQPLALDPGQPEVLLKHARPGDRVVYTSFILMPYYLIHGALRLGAAYYHPAFQGTSLATKGLSRPHLRFVVAFNPTVYHPSFEGVPEHRWWITTPEFRFSPLSRPRKFGPAARDGKIPADHYRWLDLRMMTQDFPKTLRVRLDNPGRRGALVVVPLNQAGEPLEQYRQKLQVPARWSGWLPVDLAAMPSASAFRIIFPRGEDHYQLGGLTFGADSLHWPWAQKARLTFYPRGGETEPFSVSFNPAALLPPSLKGRQVTVLDDRGSSVLLQLQR